MDPPELDELVRRARHHDPEALDAIVRAYAPRLYGLALRMTGSPDAAEDCLQETCLRMVRTIARYQHDGRFEAWLFRIAANLARDHRRQQRRRPAVGNLDGPAAESSAGAEPRVRAEANPAGRLDRHEEAAQLQASLAELPDIDREIVLLRFFGELTFQEIAEMLGVPLGTALARAHRALRKLRARLDADAARPAAQQGRATTQRKHT